MKEDRFLTGILFGIAVLVVASLSVFLLRKDANTYLPEDNPEAIVHNYIFAIQQEDYKRAYTYLAEDEYKPTYTDFLRDVISTNRDSVQIGKAEISDDTASVALTFTNMGGGIFFDQYEYTESALLMKQDGEWKLLQMSYAYWYWGWYQKLEN